MTTPITSLIPMLDHAARRRAEDNARARIAGDAPKKSIKPKLNYATITSRYPSWIMATIRTLNIVALIASLIPSAIRLFSVGSLSALDANFDDSSAIWMGAMIILISEIGAVSLQLAEANDSLTRAQRWGYRLGSGMCVAIALSGNYQSMNGHVWDNPFTALDTFVPPILALILAMALKGQMLQAVSDRHTAKTEHEAMCKRLDDEYTAAKDAHAAQLLTAHDDELWRQTYANALREEIYAANKSIGARAALLRDAACDWVALVRRELNANDWFTNAPTSPVYIPVPMDTPAPAPTIVVTPVPPAQLPPALTAEDVGLPARKPAQRKRKVSVDMSAAPPRLFEDE
ncbi:MAG: hypothetical protein ACRC6G_13730 [Deefgea sp.]